MQTRFVRLFTLLAVLAGAQVVSAQTRSAKDMAPSDRDWFSCFFTVVGKSPPGLTEFDNFYFAYSENGKPTTGGVVTKRSDLVYLFASVKVDGRELTFTTRAIRGISYGFEGRMLRRPTRKNGEVVPGAVVAEGTLRKFRGKRQAAEARLRFGCTEGGEGDE